MVTFIAFLVTTAIVVAVTIRNIKKSNKLIDQNTDRIQEIWNESHDLKDENKRLKEENERLLRALNNRG